MIVTPIGTTSCAGVLLAVLDPATVVLIDAATFAAALIGVLVPASAQPDTNPTDQTAPPRYITQLADGLRFVRTDRLLLALIIMIAVTNLLDYALFAVLLAVWVQDRLGAPPKPSASSSAPAVSAPSSAT